MDVFFLASSTGLELDALRIVEVVLLGLVAGIFGGLLGVGGSIIMIPGLTLVFGFNQHLYQAAAMIANVAVSVPAAWRHHKAKAIVPGVLKFMLPVAGVSVLFGVWLSIQPVFQGQEGSVWLGRILAMMMVYVIYANVRKLLKPAAPGPVPKADEESKQVRSDAEGAAEADDSELKESSPKISGAASGSIGAVMGTIAGLLGVGGGAIAVPLQQILLRLPLKSCIANSAAVICISASIGALAKNLTLTTSVGDPNAWQDSLLIAAILAPTCWIGGYLGAMLTHRLSVKHVRIAFILLMVVASIKMSKLDPSWFGIG